MLEAIHLVGCTDVGGYTSSGDVLMLEATHLVGCTDVGGYTSSGDVLVCVILLHIKTGCTKISACRLFSI